MKHECVHTTTIRGCVRYVKDSGWFGGGSLTRLIVPLPLIPPGTPPAGFTQTFAHDAVTSTVALHTEIDHGHKFTTHALQIDTDEPAYTSHRHTHTITISLEFFEPNNSSDDTDNQ